MANKSFVVQYLIKARDGVSKDAAKAARAFAKLDKKTKDANHTFDKSQRIIAKTALRFKKLDDQTKHNRRSFRKLRDSLTAVNRKFANLKKTSGFKFITKGLEGAAGKLKSVAKVVLTALAGVGTATLFVGSRFETSIADLAAITGATGKDLDFLKKKSLELARINITSQVGLTQAMKLIGSAKPELLKNLPALIETTKQILTLKNAGTALDTAVAAVAGGLNTFGKSAKFAAKFVNILAAGSKFGSSEINRTAEAVTIAGPAADEAGLSFLQLNAAIQTVARGTIFGTQAGTALSAIIGRLTRDSTDFRKAGLQGSFEIIKKRLDAIKNPVLRAREVAKTFGDEHGKVGLALLKNVKLLGQFERELSGTSVAEDQAAIRLNTFAKQMEKVKIILQDKLIRLFERIRPLLVENAEKLGQWFDTIDEESIKRFAASLLEVLKLIIQIGKGLGKVGTFLFGKTNIEKAVERQKEKGMSAAERGRFGVASLFGQNKEQVAQLAAEFNSQPVFKAVNGTQTNNVNVGVNVGLDQGLKQTSPAIINRSERRNDVGFNAL